MTAILSNSSPSQMDKELTLLSPCHKNNNKNKKNPHQNLYQKEVHYWLDIWNIDLTHKIKTSPNILGMVTHHPMNGHQPSQG